MPTPTRVCLVGAGRIARVHAEPLVRHIPNGRLSAIVDTKGALVTTHKIDLLEAARDMFDELHWNLYLVLHKG